MVGGELFLGGVEEADGLGAGGLVVDGGEGYGEGAPTLVVCVWW